MQRSTQWIARAVGGTIHGPDVDVTAPIVTDSREAAPGGLYVARRGENSDGHDYVGAALANGAVAAIVERAVEVGGGLTQIVVDESTEALGRLAAAHLEDLRARGDIDVIAVTGSVGKTTTKDLLAQIMSADGPTVAPKLSYNNEVGLPLTVLTADEQTRHMVLEMGASAVGHIAYLSSIAPPDAAIELMVGHAHLGGFGSIDAIARAKAELLKGSRDGAAAILNADDPRVAAMVDKARGPITTFSTRTDSGADVIASDVVLDPLGRASFTVTARGESADISLQIVGAHHVANALAAISGALVLGLGLDVIADALNRARALSPHRMDVRMLEIDSCGFTLIDDAYNANLDSMRAAFDALTRIGSGKKKIAVLSEMLELGDESADIHRAVGRMAADAGAGTLIVMGEDAHYYCEGAADSVQCTVVGGVAEAIETACDTLTHDCVVLVKGSLGSNSWKVADGLTEKGDAR